MELTKVYYRPIEAAIRWSDLLLHEDEILGVVGDRTFNALQFPSWPLLTLNCARIQDALLNGDLRSSINGIATQAAPDFANSELTIRHVDLKAWMKECYPDQRPAFLFDRIEREVHPAITVDAVQSLLLKLELLRCQLEERDQIIDALKRQIAKPANSDADSSLSPRAEMTLLNIVGALVDLIVGGRSPSGKQYSTFDTQDAVISALVATYGGRLGISESTLEAKFAAAKRSIGLGSRRRLNASPGMVSRPHE